MSKEKQFIENMLLLALEGDESIKGELSRFVRDNQGYAEQAKICADTKKEIKEYEKRISNIKKSLKWLENK